ncbi:MFS transporter [Brevibacterium casei]
MPALLNFLALAVFAQGTSEFVLAGLLADIAADLGIPLAEAGLLTTAFAVGMVLGAPVMAIFARRLSARTALTSFLIVFVAAHIAGALTGSFPVLLLTRVIAAVANAGFLAVALALIVRIVEARRRARAVGVIVAGTTLALIAGVPAGAVLGAAFGWRSALWAIAVLCVPALFAVLTAPSGNEGEQRPTLLAELAVLRSRPVLGVIAVTVLVNAATFGAFTYLAVVAEAGLGYPSPAVPILLCLFGIGAFAGVTLAGRFADAHGTTIVSVLSPCLVLVWAALAVTVASAGTGAQSGSGHLGEGLLWVLTPVVGALSFALGSTLVARIVAEARQAPNLGGAFATAALNLGATIGPVAAGLALTRLGEAGPFTVAAVGVGLSLGIWLLIRRAGILAPG